MSRSETSINEEVLSLSPSNELRSDPVGKLVESIFAHKAPDWVGRTIARVVIIKYDRKVRENMVVKMLTRPEVEWLNRRSPRTLTCQSNWEKNVLVGSKSKEIRVRASIVASANFIRSADFILSLSRRKRDKRFQGRVSSALVRMLLILPQSWNSSHKERCPEKEAMAEPYLQYGIIPRQSHHLATTGANEACLLTPGKSTTKDMITAHCGDLSDNYPDHSDF